MQTDEAFEEELRLQFSMMDSPEPSPGFVEATVRRYRRWRLRRRLMLASPALVLAAVGVVAGLGGFGGGQPGVNPETGVASMRLARFSFPLPKDFRLASVETSACRALVVFKGTPPSVPPSTGAHPYTPPDEPQQYLPSSSAATANMAAAASTDRGCLLMALTVPFTSTQATANPYVASGQKVDVDGYTGWLTTTNATHGVVQLTVELPEGSGNFQDLGIGARGLSAATLLTVVSQGLAHWSSS